MCVYVCVRACVCVCVCVCFLLSFGGTCWGPQELEDERRQVARLSARVSQTEGEYEQTRQYLEEEREANKATIVELEEQLQRTRTVRMYSGMCVSVCLCVRHSPGSYS